MIPDKQMVFEENMTMPTASEVAAVARVDFQAANVGGSGKLFAIGLVTKDMVSGTSICMKLYNSATEADGTLIYTGEVVLMAAALKGKVIGCFALPPDCLRYLTAKLIEAGAAPAGEVSLFIANFPLKTHLGPSPTP